MDKEIWKDIEGYEGLYQVSNFGRVKSLERIMYDDKGYKHPVKEKIIVGSKNHKGYLYVNLMKNSKVLRKAVHRLVAQAFISNPNNFPCVNHKDENKINNVVGNLEWVTYKENTNYGTGIERRVAHTDWSSKNDTQKKKVYQYDKKLNLIKIWNSSCECETQGFAQTHVSSCCRGERKTHKGYIWSYTPIEAKNKDKILNKLLNQEKPQAKKVYQYDERFNLIRIWESTGECGRNGFSQPSIAKWCKKADKKIHKGFIWSYTPICK